MRMNPELFAFHACAFLVSASAGAASIITTDWSVAVFGVPLSVLLAGFAGSVSALSFLPPMPSRTRMFVAVGIGTLTAGYGVRIAAKALAWGDDYLAPGAFFVGLLAHLALTWVFARLPSIADKKFGGGS